MREQNENLTQEAVRQLREAGFVVELDAGGKKGRVDIVAHAADERGQTRPDLVVEIGPTSANVLAQLSRAAVTCGARRAYVFDGSWWRADAAFLRLEPAESPAPPHKFMVPRLSDEQVRRYLSAQLHRFAKHSWRGEPITAARGVLDHIRAAEDTDDVAKLLRHRVNATKVVRILITLVEQSGATGGIHLPLEAADALVRLTAMSGDRRWRVMDINPGRGACLFAVLDHCQDRGIPVMTQAVDASVVLEEARGIAGHEHDVHVPRDGHHSARALVRWADTGDAFKDVDPLRPGVSSLRRVTMSEAAADELLTGPWLSTLADFARVTSKLALGGRDRYSDGDANCDVVVSALPLGMRWPGISASIEEVFFNAAMERLADGGRAVFLTSTSMLWSGRLRRFRRDLTNTYRVVAAIEIGFGGISNSQVPVAIVVLEKSAPTETLVAHLDGTWSEHFSENSSFLNAYKSHLSAR